MDAVGVSCRRRRQELPEIPEVCVILVRSGLFTHNYYPPVCRVQVWVFSSGRNEDMVKQCLRRNTFTYFEYFLSLLTFLPNVVLE